jgi:hypothetical protein
MADLCSRCHSHSGDHSDWHEAMLRTGAELRADAAELRVIARDACQRAQETQELSLLASASRLSRVPRRIGQDGSRRQRI